MKPQGDSLSSTDGARRERYEQIRDERILWVNVTTNELHAAYDVARDARDVDTAVRIAVQVFERNSKLLPDPQLVALRERTRVLEGALRKADAALMNARNGLDLGLGCAREVEGDHSPVPTEPRSVRQDRYLKRARTAHKEVRQALASLAAVAVEDGGQAFEHDATTFEQTDYERAASFAEEEAYETRSARPVPVGEGADVFKRDERVRFGPMPGDRYEYARIKEAPEPKVRVVFEHDGADVWVARKFVTPLEPSAAGTLAAEPPLNREENNERSTK